MFCGEKTRPYGDLYQNLMTLVGAEAEARANATATLQDQIERDETAKLIQQLENHEQNGNLSPSEYERLCLTVFAFLFDPYLHGFETQTETNDGGNRYDFVCRIKSGTCFGIRFEAILEQDPYFLNARTIRNP